MVFSQAERLWYYFVKCNLRSPRSQAAVCCLMGTLCHHHTFSSVAQTHILRESETCLGIKVTNFSSHIYAFLFVLEFLVKQLYLSRQRESITPCTKKKKKLASFYTVFSCWSDFSYWITIHCYKQWYQELTNCICKMSFSISSILPSNILLVL